ncbi:MAG: hypothetical protein OXF52_01040 [Candidatus Dadabacteria bacterium]|nr:hypothetical protein [Candidatus Dadabacteria bacterium]
MPENRLAFVLEGPDNRLELSVFARKVGQFLDLLNNTAKESGEKDVVFNVVNLSHSSPATIECEPMGKDLNQSATVCDAVEKNFRYVKEGKTDSLPHSVLTAMEKIAKFNPKKVVRAEVQIAGTGRKEKAVYKLDEKFAQQLSETRDYEETCINTIDGKLEQINIRNKANKFRIYTSLPTMPHLDCAFPPTLFEKVQTALGSYVSVSGECFYRPDEMMPYKMEVRGIEILPPPEELPSLRDIYGIFPDLTGGKSSEQFVREIRDGWYKGKGRGRGK